MHISELNNDIFYYITTFIDYHSVFNFLNTSKYLKKKKNYLLYFYKKKALILINFFKKNYINFYDLKNNNNKGLLINLNNVLSFPERYINNIIQCISWYQHDLTYLPKGYIIEGYILNYPYNTWVIHDLSSKKIHPLIDPFIFPKSIRIIKY